jgi:hypothetical protein
MVGGSVSSTVGGSVSLTVGGSVSSTVGGSVSPTVGGSVTGTVGISTVGTGANVKEIVGTSVGENVGKNVGSKLGDLFGLLVVGTPVGSGVGPRVGVGVESGAGRRVGVGVGRGVGVLIGRREGAGVGTSSSSVGASVSVGSMVIFIVPFMEGYMVSVGSIVSCSSLWLSSKGTSLSHSASKSMSTATVVCEGPRSRIAAARAITTIFMMIDIKIQHFLSRRLFQKEPTKELGMRLHKVSFSQRRYYFGNRRVSKEPLALRMYVGFGKEFSRYKDLCRFKSGSCLGNIRCNARCCFKDSSYGIL